MPSTCLAHAAHVGEQRHREISLFKELGMSLLYESVCKAMSVLEGTYRSSDPNQRLVELN